jgi:hypothetical protein
MKQSRGSETKRGKATHKCQKFIDFISGLILHFYIFLVFLHELAWFSVVAIVADTFRVSIGEPFSVSRSLIARNRSIVFLRIR